MAFSDSMFLFEVVLEKLTSFINCKTFIIKGQFADVFSLELKDPHGVVASVPRKKKSKRSTIRATKPPSKQVEKPKLLCGQSMLIASHIEKLKSDMTNFPIELSIWDCFHPEMKLGSSQIFWDRKYTNYLSKIINKKKNPKPVTTSGDHNVFDETTSKRMATVSLKIKLMHIKHGIDRPITSIIDSNIVNILDTLLKPKKIVYPSFIDNKLKNMEPFETGIITAKHNRKESSGRKKDKKFNKASKINRKTEKPTVTFQETHKNSVPVRVEVIKSNENQNILNKISRSLIDISKCPAPSYQINDPILAKSRSFTIIKNPNRINSLNYIFGDQRQSFGNKVYYVGYFTVENDKGPSSQGASEVDSSGKSVDSKSKYKIKICDSECPGKKFESDSQSHLSIDLPAEAENLIEVKKCEAIECNAKKHRETPSRPDDRILIDLGRPEFAEKIEEVMGGMGAKMKVGDDPCFCTCECTFGFTKKTTYCKVCGGYEVVGEEIVGKDGQLPFPCPIFHKLVDKNKSKTMMSTSGSDSKRTTKIPSKTEKQTSETEKSNKKGKQKNKDDRFKFNYGYEGIPPHIGHSQCAMPCKGTLGAVPKNMGWLWTAEDIPGMKFRPLWKPGATNKHVVRLLRMAKNPGQVMAKKRRRDQKPKRSLIRPLLIVHKKDGEYTVTMETMKAYNKPRAINQYPYEDKPLLTYTIGRTEAENIDRKKKREREQRRLERMQRNFIQSAFRDMCHEICLKTYQQALGILPTTESPDCPCFPAHPGPDEANLDVSCSCSDADESTVGSDTDSDEWIVEFTPPSAKFDPKFKTKKVVKVDNSTQYTYLDYRVKLLDLYGNPVPRFFKGQDGKQQCSDLGGFWSPEHKWLEINVDGFIAPDGRWAPTAFFGPNGELIEMEGGKFQAANGKWFVIGIDGYVDAQNKWRAYSRPRVQPQAKKKPRTVKDKGGAGDKQAKMISSKPSETFSCFGDASPKYLSELGIMGHGPDKKLLLAALKDLIARGEAVRIPERPLVPRMPPKKGKKIQIRTPNVYDARNAQCQHPTPSSKGVMAVNSAGDKVYFKLKDPKNKRPKQRLHDLNRRGISLSSFHVPCFHSFINSEMMKKQLQERMVASNPHNKSVATEAYPGNVVFLRP